MAWYEKAADNFNRTDENPITGSWMDSNGATGFKVLSNTAAPRFVSGQSMSCRTDIDLGSAGTYSQATRVFGAETGAFSGAGVYIQGYFRTPISSYGSPYGWIVSNYYSGLQYWDIYYVQNGAYTSKASSTNAVSTNGVVIRGEKVGSAITAYRDGTSVVTATDSTAPPTNYEHYTVGMYAYDGGVTPRSILDNWSGGDQVSTATATLKMMLHNHGG